jgi:hypothetical protein
VTLSFSKRSSRNISRTSRPTTKRIARACSSMDFLSDVCALFCSSSRRCREIPGRICFRSKFPFSHPFHCNLSIFVRAILDPVSKKNRRFSAKTETVLTGVNRTKKATRARAHRAFSNWRIPPTQENWSPCSNILLETQENWSPC